MPFDRNGKIVRTRNLKPPEVVVRPGCRKPKVPTAKPRVYVARTEQQGSSNERVVFTLSRNLGEDERSKLLELIRGSECYEDIHDIRWRTIRTIVIEVKRAAIQDLAHVDAATMMDKVLREMPVSFE